MTCEQHYQQNLASFLSLQLMAFIFKCLQMKLKRMIVGFILRTIYNQQRIGGREEFWCQRKLGYSLPSPLIVPNLPLSSLLLRDEFARHFTKVDSAITFLLCDKLRLLMFGFYSFEVTCKGLSYPYQAQYLQIYLFKQKSTNHYHLSSIMVLWETCEKKPQ